MISNSLLVSKVAEKYRTQGFEVFSEPKKVDLPFNLGTYRPGLIAKKSPSEGYIIEVRNSVSQMPIDRYREVAEVVAQHAGWSFLLVTGEDILSNEPEKDDDKLLTREQIFQRQMQAKRLLSLGETEGAFLSLWGTLEAVLRRQARKTSIPIERLPTLSLMNHMYSQGELSMEQFDKAKTLQSIRSRFIHGYQTANLAESTIQLQEMVNELMMLWN